MCTRFARTFFIFFKLCDLYGCPISDWISTCVEIGGTPEPSWEGCVQQQDGCQAYKGAICQLDSNYMINQFQLLVSATECQVFIAFTIDVNALLTIEVIFRSIVRLILNVNSFISMTNIVQLTPRKTWLIVM